jgi:hypothetical protein
MCAPGFGAAAGAVIPGSMTGGRSPFLVLTYYPTPQAAGFLRISAKARSRLESTGLLAVAALASTWAAIA